MRRTPSAPAAPAGSSTMRAGSCWRRAKPSAAGPAAPCSCPLLVAADDAADALEDAAFLLDFGTLHGEPLEALQTLAGLVADAPQECIKALGRAGQIGRGASAAETEDSLAATGCAAGLEREADGAERGLAVAAIQHGGRRIRTRRRPPARFSSSCQGWTRRLRAHRRSSDSGCHWRIHRLRADPVCCKTGQGGKAVLRTGAHHWFLDAFMQQGRSSTSLCPAAEPVCTACGPQAKRCDVMAASVLLRTLSFEMMLCTCAFTVLCERPSR